MPVATDPPSSPEPTVPGAREETDAPDTGDAARGSPASPGGDDAAGSPAFADQSDAPRPVPGARLTAWFQGVVDRVRADPLQALLFVLPVVLILVAGWIHRFMNDDGYINLRVVNNVLQGHGPVYNAGERVEAVTSPMWIAVLVVAKGLFGWALAPWWLAVVVGLLCTGAAVGFALAAGAHLCALARPAGDDDPGRMWPVGVLALVCTPPMWWYATSGLETGLSFLWLTMCFWGVVRRYRVFADGAADDADRPALNRPHWLLVLMGIGPLVRPDFLIYSVAFAAAFILTSSITRSSAWRALLWFVGAPFAYQIFRMGYYGALVPNTALAKDAGGSNWSRGWTYVSDFNSTYWIVLPLLALLALVAYQVSLMRANHRRATWLVVPLLVAAAIHVVYVVRLGGDYLHARFLLPALICVLLPVACVRLGAKDAATVPRPIMLAGAVATAGVVLWAVIMFVSFEGVHADADRNASSYGTVGSGEANPVTPDDYKILANPGREFAGRSAAGENVLIDTSRQPAKDVPLRPGQGVVAYLTGIGVAGVTSGDDVWIIDRHGLADPLASRFAENNGLTVPGHEKMMSFTYAQARFAPQTMGEGLSVAPIRHAMTCGDLAELYRATNDDLTIGRFLKNIVESPKLTMLRVPINATDMEQKFCGG